MSDSANRLVAVVFSTSDLDSAVKLYRDGFGLNLHIQDHHGDDLWTSGRHAATSWTDGEFIHFALYEANNAQVTHGAQISFRVVNLDRAHTRAVRAGARMIHEPKSQPWGLSARYFDFDGNVIELTQQS